MPGELTAEQQQAFDDRLRELGLDPSCVVEHLNTGDTPGPTRLTNAPGEESAIPPQTVVVDSVDDLKRLAGIPDADYDSGYIEHHLPAPDPWPAEKNSHAPEDLTPEERAQLAQALSAYVYGDSSKVAGYREILNHHFFPLEAGGYTAQDVTVTKDHPLIIDGNNATINFGTITIDPGGQIFIETEATVTVQKMVLLS